MAPLVAGIRAGACPVVRADGIGYPAAVLPWVSRFPLARREAGEGGAAARLLQVVGDTLGQIADDAPGSEPVAPEDFGIVVGTSGFLYATAAELYGRAIGLISDAPAVFTRGPSWGAALIVEKFGLLGPCLTVTSGCSSSANALLLATEMIRRGRARRVLVVGAEELSAVTLSGFDSLMVLDPECCRPFDRDRAGIQVGEAITAMVLEGGDKNETAGSGSRRSGHSRESGNLPDEKFARIRGGANRCDTHHLTAATPDGSVMREVMAEALANARIAPADVVAVKSHGAGSTDSDRAEAAALRALFGDALPPVLALKRHVGHALGACGTLETAALIGCVAAGFLPAAAGFRTVDPDLGVTPLREAIAAAPGNYLLNSFGFGGNYTSLVLHLG